MRSSDRLMTPGICERRTSFDLCIQSWIAKKWMLMCLVRYVGFCDTTMSIVGLLSLYIGVGSVCMKPSLHKTDLMYFAVFTAVTAAMNFALVELRAVKDWVFDM